MHLIIQPDYSGISNWVADYIAEKINQFSPTAERPFVLGLASCEAIEVFVEYKVEYLISKSNITLNFVCLYSMKSVIHSK